MLPLAIRGATKLVSFFDASKKAYSGTVTLGITTDTLDAQGEWGVGGVWPASIPPSAPLWIQAWVADALGPAGWLASNAVRTAQL